MDLKSIQVFAFILSKNKGRILKANSLTELHKAFYRLREKNPCLMGGFDFRKTTNPYSITLQELISLYVMAGILAPVYVGSNSRGYLINQNRLKDFLPEHTTVMWERFKGLQDLEKIFA